MDTTQPTCLSSPAFKRRWVLVSIALVSITLGSFGCGGTKPQNPAGPVKLKVAYLG